MIDCQNQTQDFPTTDIDERWFCVHLPVTEYGEAWHLQSNLVAARKNEIINNNVILLLEHPPVFTLGRRGGLDNLSVSEDFLKNAGIPVIQVERGGNITFHGPGQLVVYPIIDLNATRLTVTDYVEHLEEIMIRTAADWGIKAVRKPINRGVWVGNNKLGSIGIAIRKGICFHGMAFNVNISLKPFQWINPCGLLDIGVTSMAQELACDIAMNRVRKTIKHHLEAILGIELVTTSIDKLKTDCLLKNDRS